MTWRISGVPDTWGFGYAMEKWVWGKLNKTFLHFFCQKFGMFDDISKLKALQNFEKSSNMPEIWQWKCITAWFNLTLAKFLADFGYYPKLRFQEPNPSLICDYNNIVGYSSSRFRYLKKKLLTILKRMAYEHCSKICQKIVQFWKFAPIASKQESQCIWKKIQMNLNW